MLKFLWVRDPSLETYFIVIPWESYEYLPFLSVNSEITKRRINDEVISDLHRVLFGVVGMVIISYSYNDAKTLIILISLVREKAI